MDLRHLDVEGDDRKLCEPSCDHPLGPDPPRPRQPVNAVEQLGVRWLVELTTMMGYYTTLAYNANSFEIDLPEGGPEPALPV